MVGDDLVNVWGDDDNIFILVVGVLLLFCRWMVWVSCNGNDVIAFFSASALDTSELLVPVFVFI